MEDIAPKSRFVQPPPRKHKVNRDERRAKLQTDMVGSGDYVFENNSSGDLYLPRPTKSGRRMVRKGEQFVGDNYYFQMVKTNELKFIRESKENIMETRLMTEQPPTITRQGKVEYVTELPSEKDINEQQDETQDDILLNESPLDGITILK